jgi:hypothetical protein
MRPDEMSLEEQLIASTAVANHRRNQAMADKITFDVNIPQSVALKYADGKRVESRYNDYEVYYSLTDGRALYATPALDKKIADLAPAAGEVFTICKREIRDGNRKRIEWKVAPLVGPVQGPDTGVQPQEASAAAPRPVTPAPRPAAVPAPVSEAGTMTQIMGGALIAAIDALDAARKYGAGKGWTLEFNEEDVRTAASSIFIQFWRDRETRARYPHAAPQQRVNGGTQWQQ